MFTVLPERLFYDYDHGKLSILTLINHNQIIQFNFIRLLINSSSWGFGVLGLSSEQDSSREVASTESLAVVAISSLRNESCKAGCELLPSVSEKESGI